MCSVLLVKLYSVMYAMPLSDECMHVHVMSKFRHICPQFLWSLQVLTCEEFGRMFECTCSQAS